MNEFLKEILPIGVILTFIGTLVTIYYTRKNIKTTKYIDTITTERIKWIGSLRNDLSSLTSLITIYISNKRHLNTLSVNLEELKYQAVESNPYSNNSLLSVMQRMTEIRKTQDRIKQELQGVSREKIIEKIHLIKLRLNPIDDSQVIILLDLLLDFFIHPIFDSNNYDEINSTIKDFVNQSQFILKAEWDKVKYETKKGE